MLAASTLLLLLVAVATVPSTAAAQNADPGASGPAAAAAAAAPTVIHIVADDLGYHDTHWRNHGADGTSTDSLDALVKAGVEIPDFCKSPSWRGTSSCCTRPLTLLARCTW
jgi:hypothetical protein